MGGSGRARGEGDWKRQLPLDGITRHREELLLLLLLLTGTLEEGTGLGSTGLDWARLGCGQDRKGHTAGQSKGGEKTGTLGEEIAT